MWIGMAKITRYLRLTTSLAIGVSILMKRVIWIDTHKLRLNQTAVSPWIVPFEEHSQKGLDLAAKEFWSSLKPFLSVFFSG
jgi:hypothetical protein